MVRKKISSTNNKKRSLFYLLFLAIGMFIAALIAWQFYKYKIVNKGIAKAFVKKANNLYSLHYDHIQLDELKGILEMRNIEILADTTAYEKSKSTFLRRLSIPELNIWRVKTPKALLNKEIDGGKIELLNPTIEIVMGNLPDDSGMAHPYVPLYKELLGKFLQIKFDSIQIRHAHLLVRNSKTNLIAYEADNISVLLSDLQIDSTISRDSSRILFSKHFDFTCDEFKFPTKDKQYRIFIDSLHFSSQNKALRIGRIRVAARLSEEEFSKVFGMDRFDFELQGIKFLHINMKSLWEKQIVADQLIITRSSFKIFRDLSFPDDISKIVHRFPQKQVQDIPIPILIKKAIFIQSFIEYKEKNAKSDSSGKLQFYQAHATITNITNMTSAVQKSDKCTVIFGARLLNEFPINAKVILLLKNPNGIFTIEGNSKAMDARALNPLSVPMGLVRINKGDIKSCHFNFTANDSTSTGDLLILYDDFNITLLKKDKTENKYNSKVLPSLASNLVLRKSNPGSNEMERTAKVQLKWKDSKSFLNVIWNSIFVGIKKAIGINKY